MIPTTRRNFSWWGLLAFVHRWLGVLGCLLFLDWFVSGIAMIYVPVPAVHNGAHDTRHANGFPCH